MMTTHDTHDTLKHDCFTAYTVPGYPILPGTVPAPRRRSLSPIQRDSRGWIPPPAGALLLSQACCAFPLGLPLGRRMFPRGDRAHRRQGSSTEKVANNVEDARHFGRSHSGARPMARPPAQAQFVLRSPVHAHTAHSLHTTNSSCSSLPSYSASRIRVPGTHFIHTMS